MDLVKTFEVSSLTISQWSVFVDPPLSVVTQQSG